LGKDERSDPIIKHFDNDPFSQKMLKTSGTARLAGLDQASINHFSSRWVYLWP